MRAENDFLNQLNPRSFINLVPPKMKELILAIPEDVWEMSEAELIEHVYGRGKKSIPELDIRIRLALWKQYDLRCKAEHVTQIRADDFLKGLLDSRRFYKEVERNPGKLKIYITEPLDSWVKHEDIRQMGLAEMREIMGMPLGMNIKTGLPGYDLLKLKFEIFRYLDEREHGKAKQQISTENKSVNVELKADLKRFKSIAEIDAEIARLEGESRRALVEARPVLDPIMALPPEKAERVLEKEERLANGD